MKIYIEVKIYVDLEIMEKTGYSEEEIKKLVMGYPFTEFVMNEYKIITIGYKEQIRVLPHFDIYNNLILNVSYF